MNLEQELAVFLEIRGVTGAAVVSCDGDILLDVSRDGFDLGFVRELVATSLATSRMLAELHGGGGARQTMIEYESGPVLLVPVTADPSGPVAVFTLESAATLGQVRFRIRRMLPALAAAVAGQEMPAR